MRRTSFVARVPIPSQMATAMGDLECAIPRSFCFRHATILRPEYHNFAPCLRVFLQALWRKRCHEVRWWKRSTFDN
jgi:hypothetical protein